MSAPRSSVFAPEGEAPKLSGCLPEKENAAGVKSVAAFESIP